MTSETKPVLAKAGLVLARFVVPAWILAGALFKLIGATPSLLPPKTVLFLGKELGLDLYFYLAALIAIEFATVATMLFVGRLARPLGIALLSVFCLVLVGEMVQGNIKTCGCLGANSPPPYVMLAIDAALLAGLIFLRAPAPGTSARWPLPAAGTATLVGIAASLLVIIPARRAIVPPGPPPENGDQTVVDPPANGDQQSTRGPVRPPQGFWFTPTPSDMSEWVGRPWREIDLLQFLDTPPSGMDGPKRYVVFYSRTCEHCQEMFTTDLVDDALGSMVTAVEVPDSKTVLRSPDAWAMPPTRCEHLALPLGYEWIMTTPVAIRVENGVVTCAEEGGHARCLELE